MTSECGPCALSAAAAACTAGVTYFVDIDAVSVDIDAVSVDIDAVSVDNAAVPEHTFELSLLIDWVNNLHAGLQSRRMLSLE